MVEEMKTEDFVSNFCCTYCTETFVSEEEMNSHLSEKHKEGSYQEYNKAEIDLDYELAEAIKVESFLIQNEDESTDLKHSSSMKKRKKRKPGIYQNFYHHESGTSEWECKACSAKFASERGICRHLQKTTCGFGDKDDYKPKGNWRAFYTKTDENIWMCYGCGANYNSDNGVVRHIKKSICGQSYSSLYSQTGNTLTCKVCDSEFQTIMEVGEHIKSHIFGIEKKRNSPMQRRNYSQLYTRDGNLFTCVSCQHVYHSDRGVQRHLITTTCGFGDRSRLPPKTVYKGLYTREGSRWVCSSCNGDWGSDRGIYDHLKKTSCGYGYNEAGGSSNMETLIKDEAYEEAGDTYWLDSMEERQTSLVSIDTNNDVYGSTDCTQDDPLRIE